MGHCQAYSNQTLLCQQVMMPWLSATFPEGLHFPAGQHTAISTQKYLEFNMVTHRSKAVRPPCSCGQNLLDYSIWRTLQAKVNAMPFPIRYSLKQECDRLGEAMVQRTCVRVQAAVEVGRRS